MSDVEKSYDELLEQLQPQEQRFVEEYLDTYNASLAARRAWPRYKASAQKGRKALQRPDVAAAVKAGLVEQRERLGVDPDRVMLELACVALADPYDLVDAKGNVLPLRNMPKEIRRAITSLDFEQEQVEVEDVPAYVADGSLPVEIHKTQRVTTRTRIVKVRLSPKTQAIELIGKRHKMFSDRLELDAGDSLAALVAAAFNSPTAE